LLPGLRCAAIPSVVKEAVVDKEPLLCPACASPLEFQARKLGPWKFYTPRQRVCGQCGFRTDACSALKMGHAFGSRFDQLHAQLSATLNYVPQLPYQEAVRVLNPSHFDDDIHQLNRYRDLLHYCAHLYRPVLRDLALSIPDTQLDMAPIKHQDVIKALALYGHSGSHPDTESWTLLVARVLPKGFFTYLWTGEARGLEQVIRNHKSRLPADALCVHRPGSSGPTAM
jgi:hypothetical protein